MRQRCGRAAIRTLETAHPIGRCWCGCCRRSAAAKGRTRSKRETLLDGPERRGGKVESAVRPGAAAWTAFLHGRNYSARNAGLRRRGCCGTERTGGYVPRRGIRMRCGDGSRSSGKACDGPGIHQRLANGVARGIVNQLGTTEPDFNLFRMDVDVHFVVWHFQKEQGRGRNSVWMDISISLVDGVKDQLIADQSFVHENVNGAAVRALNLRARGEA